MEEEEDIEIDFSKITKFFKGKKDSKGSVESERSPEQKSEERDTPAEKPDLQKSEKPAEESPTTKSDAPEVREISDQEVPEIKTGAAEKIEKTEKAAKGEEKVEDPVKAEEKVKQPENEDEDDEISIDLGKVKKFFTSDKSNKEDKEDEDDEVSLDFSKVKNLFKRDKTKKQETGDQEDDDSGFDFGKVTSFFKGSKESTPEKDSDEVSVDLKSVYKGFMKHKTLFIIIFLIGIGMVASVHLRVQSAYLPRTYDWGRQSMEGFNRQVISQNVNQQYPNLPAENRASLAEAEVVRIFAGGNALVPTNAGVQQVPYEDALESYAGSFRERLQDSSGQTYLLAIDPYFWARHARNVLENGHPGDEIRDGIPWDNHMYAPGGRPADVSFHSYFIAFLFKLLTIFNSSLTLLQVTFFVPVIISALSVIPAFFIGRRVGGNFGGFVAGFLVGVHPTFLGRTAGGFSDTDAYNVLFPLIITWIFLEGFEASDLKKKIGLASLAGIFASIYQFTWIGWWYIFDFILAASAMYVVYALIDNYAQLKHGFVKWVNIQTVRNTVIMVFFFVLATSVLTSVHTGANGVSQIFTSAAQPVNFIKIKQVGITTVWPNVFTTVAEQNSLGYSQIINQISLGRTFLFAIAVFGIIVTVIRRDRNGHVDAKSAILLALWFGATIFASTKGIRFLLLLVPAFAIAVGIALGSIYRWVSNFVTKEFSINKYISRVVVLILLSIILIAPWRAGTSTALNEVPSMNDAWWNSLERIRLQSAPDAIVNSWWDFGHWFKFIADRKVTFDGTSQNSPQAHWIGRVLLTDDETTAVGVLRMLDCSGYEGGTHAFDSVNEVTGDSPTTIDVLYEIMVLDEDGARAHLAGRGFPSTAIDEIVQFTHCQPPENYFITSEDMIGKSGVWGHFGSWNFKRAAIYNDVQTAESQGNPDAGIAFVADTLGIDPAEAENIYYEALALQGSQEANNWIAPWPSYASGISGCNTLSEDMISCPIGNGVVNINTSSWEAVVPSQQGDLHPNSLVWVTEDGISAKYYNNTVGASITLIPQGSGYQSVLAATEQAESMFTRMFFLEGHGLRHFKKFSDERSVFGGRIIVWKVDWEGSEPNNVYFTAPPEPSVDPTVPESVNETAEEIDDAVNETAEPNETDVVLNDTPVNETPESEDVVLNETDESVNDTGNVTESNTSDASDGIFDSLLEGLADNSSANESE